MHKWDESYIMYKVISIGLLINLVVKLNETCFLAKNIK